MVTIIKYVCYRQRDKDSSEITGSLISSLLCPQSLHFPINSFLCLQFLSPAQITVTLISLLPTHPLASFTSFFTFRANF